MSTTQAIPLVGHVVGENVKRLREGGGLTQAEAALRLQAAGLRWQRSHVAALEAGNRESIDVGTLALLAWAIQVSERDLFAGDGEVRLTPEAVVTREWLRRRYAQGRPGGTVSLSGHAARAAAQEQVMQADIDLAMRLGVRPEVVTRAAQRLWGRSLHQERNRRIAKMGDMPAKERQARRGHITRQLAKELEPYLPNGPRKAKP